MVVAVRTTELGFIFPGSDFFSSQLLPTPLMCDEWERVFVNLSYYSSTRTFSDGLLRQPFSEAFPMVLFVTV